MIRSILLTTLTACWSGTNVTITRVVPVAHYIHDEPKTCKGLPEFPSVALLGHHEFVGIISKWVLTAGSCLNVHVYDLSNLIEEVQW